ncbi:MAG: FAD-dependent oxidoreductase [Pseudomonadota bacterium]
MHETFDRLGGNHRSRNINGYTFDIGSFIFRPGYPIFQHFPGLEARCVSFTPGNQRLSPRGEIRKYPYDPREVMSSNPLTTLRYGSSLTRGRLTPGTPANAETYLHRVLGRELYQDLGLAHYLRRFYGVEPSTIDRQFVDDRMQFLLKATEPAALVRTVRKMVGSKSENPVNGQAHRMALARPRDGFDALYTPVRDSLEARGVTFQLGADLVGVQRGDGGFEIALGDRTVRARRLINTMPLPVVGHILDGAPDIDLKSSRLISLYVSFEGARAFSAPVFFNFHADGRWKRLTMHSDVYGKVGNRAYFCVEVPELTPEASSIEALFEDFRTHVSQHGVFDGDMNLEGGDVSEHAYPVYSIGYQDQLRKGLAHLESLGIESVGRQGRFDYLPTSHGVMTQVDRHLNARAC